MNPRHDYKDAGKYTVTVSYTGDTSVLAGTAQAAVKVTAAK